MFREIEIMGIPKPQARHRSTRVGGFIRNYDPCYKSKKEFADKVRSKAPKKDLKGNISLSLTFYMPRPKNHWKTKKGRCTQNLKEWAKEHRLCRTKPDVDNLAKYVMDSCNEILWKDDCLIVRLQVEKLYVEDGYNRPRTLIEYWLVED